MRWTLLRRTDGRAHRTARTVAAAAALAASATALGACSNSQEPAGPGTPAPAATTTEQEGGPAMTDAPTPAELDGAVFTSTAVTGHELVPGSTIEATFQGDTASLHAGCNRLFGGYTIVDGTLTVPQAASTMMACEPALMEQDQWLTQLLAAGATIGLDGDALTLAGAAGTPFDGTAITFARQG
ncbi:META domain-containing protein [Tomitella gaofuii]|uniref:META domain-containing protein n=1 Tax=Tomitella gaofuii TaxID=2760083 RepID=UPI0015FB9454|nr:META domain-containing protein [Tomitella gaofuii]